MFVNWRAVVVGLLVGTCASLGEPECEADEIGHLQLQKAKDGQGPRCPLSVLNSGDCVGDGACLRCEPSEDGMKIPTNDSNGFPSGFLYCFNDPPPINEAATCTIERNNVNSYSFQNPNDYLNCTGPSACFGFRLRDFSALCCDGNQACRNDDRLVLPNEFRLVKGNPNCDQDVCCRGIRSCSNGAVISGARSAACRSFNACEEANMFLSKDLFCSRPVACRRGNFSFAGGGTHCVQCLDAGSPREPFAQPCEESQMSFKAGKAELQCARNTCNNSVISLSESSCIHIRCEDSISCGGMAVNEDDSSGNSCFCSGPGCSSLVGTLTCNEPSTAAPCGENICKSDGTPSAFCDRGLADPPDCSSCATGGGMHGDPHISTLDGRNYRVRAQGNFLLWGFSGLDAEVPSPKGLMKRVPLDFRIYANYARQGSWAKGILLVDYSGVTELRQALEFTSEDCAWKTKTELDSWQTLKLKKDDAGFLQNLVDADGAIFGAFKVTKSAKGAPATFLHSVQLFMGTQSGLTKVAQLWVTCRAGNHLAAKLKMSSVMHNRFVKGELALTGHSSLVTGSKKGRGVSLATSDMEFAEHSSWSNLGGSETAETYLASLQAAQLSLAAVNRCTAEEETAAVSMCQKHLGKSGNAAAHDDFLADCAFDICAGGGEAAAQLAADLLNVGE